MDSIQSGALKKGMTIYFTVSSDFNTTEKLYYYIAVGWLNMAAIVI